MAYINTVTKEYPVYESDIVRLTQNFSVPFVAPAEYSLVIDSPKPEYNYVIEIVESGQPILVDGQYIQTWNVVSKFVEYTLDNIVHTVEQQNISAIQAENLRIQNALIDSLVQQVQDRLDHFAQTRNYDTILSASTYATDTNPKFSVEGQFCVTLRSATWAKMYEILGQVLAGARPLPTTITDFETELPALTWPL